MKRRELLTATEMKKLLTPGASGISQRQMARMLDINERTMRKYVSGESPIPRVVQVAVSCFIDHDDEHRDEWLSHLNSP
jgi:plasmid maintenance system antidote protein VapI